MKALTDDERFTLQSRRVAILHGSGGVHERAAAAPEVWRRQLEGVTWANGPEGVLSSFVSRVRLDGRAAMMILDDLEAALREESDPLRLVARIDPATWRAHTAALEAP